MKGGDARFKGREQLSLCDNRGYICRAHNGRIDHSFNLWHGVRVADAGGADGFSRLLAPRPDVSDRAAQPRPYLYGSGKPRYNPALHAFLPYQLLYQTKK